MTLIKSVLNSILIYFLSFFRIPKKVVDKLVKLQRWLLWGVTQSKRRSPGLVGAQSIYQRRKEIWESET